MAQHSPSKSRVRDDRCGIHLFSLPTIWEIFMENPLCAGSGAEEADLNKTDENL